MSSSRAFTLLLLAAAMATGSHAQTARTRAEVKAELAEAIRTGNMIGSGESGLTQRELNPQRYRVTAGSASTLTRAKVTGEFQQARAAGELVGVGESGLPLNENAAGPLPAKGSGRRQDPRGSAGRAARTEPISNTGSAERCGSITASGAPRWSRRRIASCTLSSRKMPTATTPCSVPSVASASAAASRLAAGVCARQPPAPQAMTAVSRRNTVERAGTRAG